MTVLPRLVDGIWLVGPRTDLVRVHASLLVSTFDRGILQGKRMRKRKKKRWSAYMCQ
jgi:hypothetical protein